MSRTRSRKFENDYRWQDETAISGDVPTSIRIRDVSFLGRPGPRMFNMRYETPTYFDSQGGENLISTALVHHLEEHSKNDPEAWDNFPNNTKVILTWLFPGQEAPAFTYTFRLVADMNPWIVFARDINRQWNLANNVQQTTALRAPLDSYTIYSQPPDSRVPYCSTCGRRATRPKGRRTTICDHQCWGADEYNESQRAAFSTRTLSDQSWDDNGAAQQRQGIVSRSILESTRRIATDAWFTSGSTEEFRHAAEFSQRMLTARLHREREQGFP